MSDTRDPDRDQPLPQPGRLPVQDILVHALLERRDHGVRKYGRPLETHNGRNPMLDLWEELLDALSYCTQALLESGHPVGDMPPGAFVPLREGTQAALRLVMAGPRAVECRACRTAPGTPCQGVQRVHAERVAAHRDQLIRTLRAALGAPTAAPQPGPAVAPPASGTAGAPGAKAAS